MTDHLHRELAPISEAAWEAIDAEAKARLTTNLAARKLVDFVGPHGWSYSVTNLGRTSPIPGPSEGVHAVQRRALPLVELRAEFTVARLEIDDFERGATDLDLSQLDAAAGQIAQAENVTVFHGYPAAGIQGIIESTSHDRVLLAEDVESYPSGVARATDLLRRDHRARGPFAPRPPPPDPRRAARVGAGSGRRGRGQLAGWGLPFRLRPGPVRRLPRPRRRHGPVVPRRELQFQGPRGRCRRGSKFGRLGRGRLGDRVAPGAHRLGRVVAALAAGLEVLRPYKGQGAHG